MLYGRDHSPVSMFWNASSTLLASSAEVSMKERWFSARCSSNQLQQFVARFGIPAEGLIPAKFFASSVGTALRCLRSLLFPTSMMTIFESA